MSYRNDSDVPYDLSLLYSVPESPNAEKQDHRAQPPLVPNRLPTDQQGGQPENVVEDAIANVPWYRMRRGITAIVIIVIIIIAGIVSGAVGGTHYSSPEPVGSSSIYTADSPITSSYVNQPGEAQSTITILLTTNVGETTTTTALN